MTTVTITATIVDSDGKPMVVYDSGPQNVTDETVSDLTKFVSDHAIYPGEDEV